MKINKSTEHIVLVIVLLILSSLYIFVARIGYKKQNINLNSLTKITSIVKNKGEDSHVSTKGNAKVFFVELENLNKKLGVYRMSRNYENLLSRINIGDTITACYIQNNNKTENVNIDLVEIEKNGKIILPKSEYQKKESTLIYIGIFGIIANLYIYYRYLKKNKKLKS